MTHAIISLKKNTHFLTYAFALCFTFFASTQLIAQVGINTTNPKANLDVTASNPTTPTNMDGLLVPRVSNFPSTSPTANQNGMLVFYTTSGGANTPGFYYWNQPTTAWVKVTDENSIISQYWSKSGTFLSPTTTGDDLLFGNNEHITLKNASTTPDPFIYMYQSIGSNVERIILRENPSSAIDFSFNPTTNAFLFKNGTTNTVTIDVDNNTPLDVLGSISLGNTGNKYTLPNNNGNANDILVSDGAGNTSWTNFGSSNIGFWSKIGTSLSPTTTGDDLVFGNNEHISLKNASTTPDPFIYMYQSNGSNVERTILRENPTSAIDFSFNPTNNAFLFKNGTTNYVTIDVGNNTPLDVLGSISLGNTGNKYTLPNNNGNANDILVSDGAGNTSWTNFGSANIGFWSKIGTSLSPTTTGDDLVFGNNEHISLKNASTTPDPFIYMYQSNGSNVERIILRENPSSAIDFSFNPITNAYLFKNGTTNTVTIDVDNSTPLDVLGSISLGDAGNKYTLPNNNGSANQFLQTNGTGVASWVDLPIDTDHDFYKIGTTSSPTTIADDIFTQGRMVVGGTNFTNTNAVIQASKTGQSYIQVTSTDNGVTGFNLDRVGSQNYSLFSTSVSGISVLSFTRANGSFNGWSQDFTLDENGDFTIAAVTNELDNKVGIGINMVGFTEANKVTIKGHGNDAATTALKIKNLAGNDIFDFKNNGELTIGGSTTGYTFPINRGTANQILQTDGSGNVSWVNNPLNANWTLNGNAGTNASSNFIGTTDNINLSIRTNNVERILVKTDGTTEIKNELIINNITSASENAILLNDNNYSQLNDNNIDFGTGLNDYIIATQQGINETAGLHGDGNYNVLWSPGDLSRQLRILDEDQWNDNDGDPYNNAAEVAFIDNTGQYFQASDKNRKQNIKKLEEALSKIEQLNGYTYQFKINDEERKKGQKVKTTSGILAQELYKVLPEAVEKTEYGEYFVHYAGIMPLLIEGMKELKIENDRLKEKQKTLEERLAKIEAMLQKN